jgi:hypothetical protein
MDVGPPPNLILLSVHLLYSLGQSPIPPCLSLFLTFFFLGHSHAVLDQSLHDGAAMACFDAAAAREGGGTRRGAAVLRSQSAFSCERRWRCSEDARPELSERCRICSY